MSGRRAQTKLKEIRKKSFFQLYFYGNLEIFKLIASSNNLQCVDSFKAGEKDNYFVYFFIDYRVNLDLVIKQKKKIIYVASNCNQESVKGKFYVVLFVIFT